MIKPGRKKYYVSKEKRTVAAVPVGQRYVGDDFCSNAKAVPSGILERAISLTTGVSLWIDLKAGVAKCAEGDTFDESVGRIIASAKGDAAFHVQMVAMYDKAIDGMKEAIALAEEMQQKHRVMAEACRDVVLKSAASAKEEEA